MSLRKSCLMAIVALAGAALAVFSLPASTDAAPPPFPGVQVRDAFPGVTFKEPVHLTYAQGAANKDALFVVQQSGQIVKVAKWRGAGAVSKPTTWLDLTSKVANQQQGGLLSAAFHPRFEQNGRVFVSYVRKVGETFELVISEFKGNASGASAATERQVLRIAKKWAIHQAGTLTFGPQGMLFISVGDGGAKDGGGHPDNARSLLGKILRIDVDNVPAGQAYGIPADNPWAKANPAQVRPEIWAYGFRNPWKIAFDSKGRLWTTEPGTKGPKSREWVHVVQASKHHGWPNFEGTAVGEVPKNVARITPVFEYVRGTLEGTAGVGGVVYEGARVPGLRGRYVFADYTLGEIYAIDVSDGMTPTCTNHRLVGKVAGANFAGISRDADGEVYAYDNSNGKIYTLASQ